MRALIQRVTGGSVTIDGEVYSKIGFGMVVLLGIAKTDTAKDVEQIAKKLVNLRIFNDEEGRLNRSLLDIAGEALIVSQFTLYADCTKGLRPGFEQAAPAEHARTLYEQFVEQVRLLGVKTGAGIFQADMLVEIANDGPVTVLLESK